MLVHFAQLKGRIGTFCSLIRDEMRFQMGMSIVSFVDFHAFDIFRIGLVCESLMYIPQTLFRKSEAIVVF